MFVPIVALGGLLGTALLVALWRAFFSRLASAPGPFAARFTDLWYASRVYNGEFEKDNLALHEKHGPIVRYGPNRISIADPLAASVLYGPGSKFLKSSWYQAGRRPYRGTWTLFTDQDPHHHAHNRRLYQSTYSMSSLVHYEPYVDDCADIFCQRLSEMSTRDGWTRGIDMGHWLQCYAFDVIGVITYSKRIGFLDFGEDVGNIMGAIDEGLTYFSVAGVYPRLHPILFRIRNWLAGPQGKGAEYIFNFTQEHMAAHRSNPKAQPEATYEKDAERGEPEHGQRGQMDFLTKFLQKHSEAPTTFTPYHVIAGCLANMGAGSDTTSISLGAIVYYVLHNPEVLKKLREEVDEHCSQSKATPNITFAQSQEMPYLQAVIKEALRLHPATGLPLERVVPAGGVTISGQFFPEGTIVGINCWVEHRLKTIWGADADTFNPDRWLTADKERLSVMNRHWIPFGMGSRTCIGRHISMLEISKLIPRLIRDFDMELCDTKSWKTRNSWFVKPKGFKVLVRPRAA